MKIKGALIDKCQELIKSFNPVTHSIDTHVSEYLGDVTEKVGSFEILLHIMIYFVAGKCFHSAGCLWMVQGTKSIGSKLDTG